ncbi:hypothetical protein EJ02DRAFT_392010 [Clathrospora elynae]|uniref:Conidiation protein 6 n=1 Tax=Clathrospora elynae TaxID=706981 RepID=A0A6A5T4J6_9PLEO|nr:hypothetical protein EJ02DRAFT_392010 [Clathrospora elynae]
MSANSGNVIGGHKANLNNPNTSEESKEHSRDVIQNAEKGGVIDSTSKSASSSGEKNSNNVAGGLKATLNNPNTEEDAKESAKEMLNSM